jgi:NCAIR mutase (PurE)-related protein
MDLTDILKAIKDGKMDLNTAERQALGLGFVSYSGIAKLDPQRQVRTGVIEAILADCKESDDVVELVRVMVAENKRALITVFPKSTLRS